MLKRMLHSAQTVLTKPVTLTGTEIQAKETVNAKFDDFKMYGKTTQDGEPSPDNPIEIVNAGKYNEETGRYEIGICAGNRNLIKNEATSTIIRGVNFTVNKDSSVIVKGANEHPVVHADLYLNKKLSIKAGKYIFSDGGGTNDCFCAYHVIGTTNYGYTNRHGNNRIIVTFDKDVDVEIYIRASGGATVDCIIYPMLRYYDDDSAYVPHVSQSFTTTSPVPLTKWDKLVKRDGIWCWSIYGKEYKMTADEAIITGNNPNKDNVRLYIMNVNANMYSESKCNIFSCSESGGTINIAGYHYNGNFAIYISNTILSQYGYEYDETLYYDTLIKRAADAYRELIRAAGGIQIVVDMQEEQAFYPLPDEEQALVNSLQSYYPTTIIRNTEDLEMEVTMKSLNILGGGISS